MPTIQEISVSPGGSMYFDSTETTTILEYISGSWSGIKGDPTIFNSDDAPNKATINIPSPISLSYSKISNINVVGSTITVDSTCLVKNCIGITHVANNSKKIFNFLK